MFLINFLIGPTLYSFVEKNKNMKNYKFILFITSIFFSTQGCLNLGPSTINKNRNSYNSIIQKTNDEQLLLNLVRLKYHDTPFFMEIANVTSQHKFSTDLSAEAIFPKSGLNVRFSADRPLKPYFKSIPVEFIFKSFVFPLNK